ncbi:MAG: glycoside hydrolase family 88 protein [Defluviitaleaceae bacterium]|nr:glycoside hydrolase family 88 protein [Defluviitaleaceae bacterium]
MQILEFVDGLLATSTPATPAWNVEFTSSGKAPKWNYIDGCMMKAIMDLFHATGNMKYFDFVKQYIDFYVDEDGKILGFEVEEYNCDNINMGKVLFDLYHATKEEKYKKAIELQYVQLETHPRVNVGNFWHKKIYPNQIWLDGLYMVQPLFMEYDMLFNQRKNYKDSFNQFKNVYEIMRDPVTGLYFHGYDESREIFWADKTTGLSLNFWTRSIGWFAMALVDTAEKLDEQFFHEYETLQKYLKELLDGVMKFQDPKTKLFYQVTNMGERDGNYLETSGSAAIAYALMKGARLGYIPSYYYDQGKEIFDAIVAHKLVMSENEFVLKDVCLVAGLGGMPGHGDYKLRDGTYEYYISEPRVNNDAKGLAPFLFSYAEIVRHEQKGENT